MGQFELRERHFNELFKVAGKEDALSAAACISGGKRKIVCINDDVEDDSMEEIAGIVRDALASLLPDKSSFEI